MQTAPQNQPQQPAPQSAPIQAVPTTAAPAIAKGVTQQPTPGVKKPLPVDQSKRNRRFLIACLTAFGCSLLLFVGILFAFLAFGSTENPIFGFLGVPPTEVVNVLITIINLIFLILVFVAFIFVVVGIFKITTAKKDDKEAKKRGMFFTFGALTVLFFMVFFWIVAYFFLSSKRTVSPTTAIATEPAKTTNLTAPVTIKFDASRAPINRTQYNILSYNWDFGTGKTARGVTQTHTFTEIGDYSVTLTIIAKEKSTNKEEQVQFIRDVTISNVLATVDIKADKVKGEAPLTVKLDGSGSSSENGEITAYSWDLNEDGIFDDSNEEKTEVTLDKIGVHVIKLRLTDSTGAFAIGEKEIEVIEANAPVAVISVDGVTTDTLQSATGYVFNAVGSTSPNGKIEKYLWDFGDGDTAQTRSVRHVFKESGEYTVRLTITDSEKKSGESTKKFTVRAPESAPLVSLETDPVSIDDKLSGQAPFTVIFDASKSQDPNNDIVDYNWDFDGDGKTDDANPNASYTFTTAGTYNVSLTVTDSTDLKTTKRVIVKVSPPGISADISADITSGVVPLTVTFDASGSRYPGGRIVSYEWKFGDDDQKRIDVAKVSHRYTQIGTFTAEVTAVGADNSRATAQVIVNVRPVSLNACFTPTLTNGKAPLTVQFDPTCSTGTVVQYQWDFAKLGKSVERKPTFTFQNPGSYPVTLEVSDNQNVVDTYTITIKVE